MLGRLRLPIGAPTHSAAVTLSVVVAHQLKSTGIMAIIVFWDN
jgi:hypothetical protein